MGVSSDAIEEIYTLLCQDPDTGAVPADVSSQINTSNNHESFFWRFRDGYDISDAGVADRAMFVEYQGHNAPGTFGHPTDTQGTLRVEILIRYHVGDYDDETQKVMADDFHLVRKILGRDSARPNGVMGYRVTGSDKDTIGDKHGYLLVLTTEITLIGDT